ncbi:MAG: L-threonylcarbamoyladenylate synthase [Bacteroidota bacterium]
MRLKPIKIAAQYLQAGEVVAIPTETVYGLGANAYDPEAVQKIYAIKNRPHTSPLIVHTHDLAAVSDFVEEMPRIAVRLARCFWPGGLTLLLKKKSIIPPIVTAGLPTVGVRIPAHPLTQQVLQLLNFPIAAPSANPFGYISPTTAQHVAKQLGRKVAYILDGGPSSLGVESTIIGFQGEKAVLYRQGSVPEEDIQRVIGSIGYYKSQEKPTIALTSGTLLSHYAPRTPLIVGSIDDLLNQYQGHQIAMLGFDQYVEGIPRKLQFLLSPKKSLVQAAQRLFIGLHYLDDLGVDKIISSYLPSQGVGKAINDRLRRASYSLKPIQ